MLQFPHLLALLHRRIRPRSLLLHQSRYLRRLRPMGRLHQKSPTTLHPCLHPATTIMKRMRILRRRHQKSLTNLQLRHPQETKVRRLEAFSHPVMLPHPPRNPQTPIHRHRKDSPTLPRVRHRKDSPTLPRVRLRRVTIQSRKTQSPLNRAQTRPTDRTTRTRCLETPRLRLPLPYNLLEPRP